MCLSNIRPNNVFMIPVEVAPIPFSNYFLIAKWERSMYSDPAQSRYLHFALG